MSTMKQKGENDISFIVKGLDMPKGYGHIILEIYPNGTVWADWESEPYDKDDVQAIQIPKGHGRLIDGDALATVLDARISGKASLIAMDATTILEAEE